MEKYGELSEISRQECQTFSALCTRRWQTMHDLSRVTGLPKRSINTYMLKFLALGLVDLVETFPRHSFRLSKFASKRNSSYLERLRRTKRIFDQMSGASRLDTITN